MPGETTREGLALMHGEVSRQIIGAFYDVYHELGYGDLEAVYQRAFPIALTKPGVRCQREVPLAVHFRGVVVGDYRADLRVEGQDGSVVIRL